MTDKLPRRPLAFGITKWGPVPGTRDAWLFWGGPGERIYAYASDPEQPGALGHPVEHPTANGTYDTVKAADAAVQAFHAIYLAEEAKHADADAG